MSRALSRELGVVGATFMGLGAMVGTGVFVSLGLAAGHAGPALLLGVVLAALLATSNALSSAQLAASHPVSGGAYEYGYRYVRPAVGFAAGWVFLTAKSASAATAALGLASYLLDAVGAPVVWRVPVAAATVLAVTALVAGGIRRSDRANMAIVGVTLLALAAFVVVGAGPAWGRLGETLTPFFTSGPTSGEAPLRGLAHATALLFVAYTGYGRIATLGEEVREPRRTIPRAIVATMIVTAVLYLAVAFVAVGFAGAGELARVTAEEGAPLEILAARFAPRPVALWVSVGAVTAMLGVLLNLVLGLSRVMLAMGRRGDLPRVAARIDAAGSPRVAVWATGALVVLVALPGDLATAWSVSAFAVLVYYAINHVAALRLPKPERLYPRWIAWAGLAACCGLAFQVDVWVWASGLAWIALGLVARRLAGRRVAFRSGTD